MIRKVELPDGSMCFRMTRKDAEILHTLCDWDGISMTAELKQALRTRYEKRMAERKDVFRNRNGQDDSEQKAG